MNTPGNFNKMAEIFNFVLDSYALLSYLGGEAGEYRVVDLLRQSAAGSCRLYMSLINLGEVIYIIERKRGLPSAQIILGMVERLPLTILEVDRPSVLAAAHLKALFPIAYADAFAASTAQTLHGVLVTGDPEFRSLEKLISIEWLPGTVI